MENNSYSRRPFHSHQIANHDSSSRSSISNASPQTLVPPTGLFGPGSSPHPHGLSAPVHHLPGLTRSPGTIDVNNYRPYGTSSISSATTTGSLPDHMVPGGTAMAGAGISSGHLGASNLSQKRAYRQRRKDPSCDACRERKVKCDATEMSSCSECSSRAVKCQFTKETNRRMSSIKQVQDLQSQLADAKSQITQLRYLLREGGAMDLDGSPSDTPALKLPEIVPNAERKFGPTVMNNFDHVRNNIRIYGRGIFKIPPPYRQIAPLATFTTANMPALPPKHTADRLLSQYYNSIHRHAPLLHWPTFQHECEKVYTAGSFQGVSIIWVSLFFAVLACGTLQTTDKSPGAPTAETEGKAYIENVLRTLYNRTDEITIDHARTTLLMSVFTNEANLKAAGWVWLGSAVRMAQDIGLHCETGPWPVIEGEVRRRVWWAIYAWDRLLSLELGRPHLIDDADCDVGWPCPVDDEWIQPQGIIRPPAERTAHSNLATVIPVVRFISQLKKTLKSRSIAPATLRTYDDYFHTVMSSFPEQYQVQSDSYLEPHSLSVVFTLQIARFHLYRHNLSPECAAAERIDALDRCYAVARDTVKYISRTMQTPPPSPDRAHYSNYSTMHVESWKVQLLSTVSNMFCTHLWRCMLILCFRANYTAALTCIHVSATIGEQRKINTACGRNLAFFLDRLTERIHRGNGSQQQLELDEEMLAYVSGDQQGCTENSWVWAGSDTGIKLNAAAGVLSTDHTGRTNGEILDGTYAGPPPSFQSAFLTEKEAKDWGGWERVERMVAALLEEQRSHHHRPPQTYYQHQHPPQRLHLAPLESPAPSTLSPSNGVSPGGSSRISIANII